VWLESNAKDDLTSLWIILKTRLFWDFLGLVRAALDIFSQRSIHTIGPRWTCFWWWFRWPPPGFTWGCPGTTRGLPALNSLAEREKSPLRRYSAKRKSPGPNGGAGLGLWPIAQTHPRTSLRLEKAVSR
jgi:hypothetical protein